MIMAWHRSSRDEPAPQLHIPGVGPAAGDCSGRQRRRSEGLPIRTQLLGLDRAGPQAALERRPGQARQYQQTAAIAICAACSLTGALAVIRYAKIHGTKHRPWLAALLARRPTKVAAIALANKIARMAWAMMARGERYKEPAALAALTRSRRISGVM